MTIHDCGSFREALTAVTTPTNRVARRAEQRLKSIYKGVVELAADHAVFEVTTMAGCLRSGTSMQMPSFPGHRLDGPINRDDLGAGPTRGQFGQFVLTNATRFPFGKGIKPKVHFIPDGEDDLVLHVPRGEDFFPWGRQHHIRIDFNIPMDCDEIATWLTEANSAFRAIGFLTGANSAHPLEKRDFNYG